jgi:hypothetical protein
MYVKAQNWVSTFQIEGMALKDGHHALAAGICDEDFSGRESK